MASVAASEVARFGEEWSTTGDETDETDEPDET